MPRRSARRENGPAGGGRQRPADKLAQLKVQHGAELKGILDRTPRGASPGHGAAAAEGKTTTPSGSGAYAAGAYAREGGSLQQRLLIAPGHDATLDEKGGVEFRYMDALNPAGSAAGLSPTMASGAAWTRLMTPPVAVPDLSFTGVESAMSPPPRGRMHRYPRVTDHTGVGRETLRLSIVDSIRSQVDKSRLEAGRARVPAGGARGRGRVPGGRRSRSRGGAAPQVEEPWAAGHGASFSDGAATLDDMSLVGPYFDANELRPGAGGSRHSAVPSHKVRKRARTASPGRRARSGLSPSSSPGHDAGTQFPSLRDDTGATDDGDRAFAGDDDAGYYDERPRGRLQLDFDPDDPEAQAAITKLQAMQRGRSSRRRVDSMRAERRGHEAAGARADGGESMESGGVVQLDFDPDDPEAQAAITKLQAVQRGRASRARVAQLRSNRSGAEPSARVGPTPKREEGIVLDFDPDDPEAQAAITKLQAIQRGRQTRKKGLPRRSAGARSAAPPVQLDFDPDDPEAQAAITKLQAIQRGRQTRKQQRGRAKPPQPAAEAVVLDFDPDDPEAQAAITKLQAIQRGRQARKAVQSRPKKRAKRAAKAKQRVAAEPVVLDFDPDDPEAQAAITKLQAIQRGRQTRKKGFPSRKSRAAAPKEEKVVLDFDPDDPEAQAAITKLQAIQRGRQTRRKGLPRRSEAPPKERKKSIVLDFDPDDPEAQAAITKLQAIQRGRQTRKKGFKARKSRAPAPKADTVVLDFDPNDPEAQAAITKLQAIQRGRQTRRKGSGRRSKGSSAASSRPSTRGSKRAAEPEVKLDFDPDDPEAKAAITKLQAIQRGRQTRRSSSRRLVGREKGRRDAHTKRMASARELNAARDKRVMGGRGYGRNYESADADIETLHSSKSFRRRRAQQHKPSKLTRKASIRIQSVARAFLAAAQVDRVRMREQRRVSSLQLATACRGVASLRSHDLEQILTQAGQDTALRVKAVSVMHALFELVDEPFDWHDTNRFLLAPHRMRELVMLQPKHMDAARIDRIAKLVAAHRLEAVARDPACPPLRLLAEFVVAFTGLALLHAPQLRGLSRVESWRVGSPQRLPPPSSLNDHIDDDGWIGSPKKSPIHVAAGGAGGSSGSILAPLDRLDEGDEA